MTTLDDDAYVINNTDYPDHLNPRYFRIINYATISGKCCDTHGDD